MSALKISYNGSEISSVDATSPVSVIYNNSTIATLNDGDTKTLCCNGKVMESDVSIGGKTLNCSGKLMQGDIVVELAGSTPSGETWYFNDAIGKFDTDRLYVNFTSNGTEYTNMEKMKTFKLSRLYYGRTDTGISDYAYNYNSSTWQNEAYRTIVLDEPATGNVLAFLEANATKIS